ncbi:DNA translocase FtsK 4TM domain-containing protein [Acetobacteraceae bacterium KSS8]|uniref:DNA translocase FtsK n=1 Tax=Endosaccharibacter trunci TaxID=2812733 RepID=A0ABT1W6U6_9PROT|nr:DNA translocase FtsK 4TM domain-containing protein [Acetobacteraceae bacterium KSS8]
MHVAHRSRLISERFASPELQSLIRRRLTELGGLALALAAIATLLALLSYDPNDSSFNTATSAPVRNLLGAVGATLSDLVLQALGLAGYLPVLVMLAWAWRIASHGGLGNLTIRLIAVICTLPVLASVLAGIPLLFHVAPPVPNQGWSALALPGGSLGLSLAQLALSAGQGALGTVGGLVMWLLGVILSVVLIPLCLGLSAGEWRAMGRGARRTARLGRGRGQAASRRSLRDRFSPAGAAPAEDEDDFDHVLPGDTPFSAAARQTAPAAGHGHGHGHGLGTGLALRADPREQERAPKRARRSADRREPSFLGGSAPAAPKPALPSRSGWVMPPSAEDEPEEQPILPLRSRAARLSARPEKEDAPAIRLSGPVSGPVSGTAPEPVPQAAVPREPRSGMLSRLLGGRGDAGAEPQRHDAAHAGLPPHAHAAAATRLSAGVHGPLGGWHLPPLSLLQPAPARSSVGPSNESLQANARLLETVLSDYGVQGAIGDIHAGPVVTLYELEPAPGIRSARVIGLADDIARSLSVTAVRIATVPGRNVIGIEVPNARRETVFFSELLDAEDWNAHPARLCLALGKDISGAPVYADLARMPHLLIAGTTGSGKSVGINSMILSLLYRLSPDECRLIMIDPKMLELSIYDGIPHLMTPVVTDPAKAVTALKWTVREMERRYRGMSQLGVRNINGYNERVAAARLSGETMTRKVQTGFDPETGRPIFEEQNLSLEALPYIVVVIDEMADLMMVAGKEIESTVQRLAQMARAAGIHVIMATQRPSVDVITGTIKANFPTRISFQVISKFDSRTILGEQGAEQLLGQGDMLYMAGGGRITRVHGPFVGDAEVEEVVRHLKSQGEPAYVDDVTALFEEEGSASGGGGSGNGLNGGGFDGETGLFDQAVALVSREGKASTSFIQRHLSIGYNRAAKLIEQMEKEGIVSAANHVGRREVLTRRRVDEE